MQRNLKLILFFITTNLFSLSETPKVTLGDIANTIHCVQGKYSCACCERFFDDCKKGTSDLFEGQCTDLDAQIEEIRNSIIADD